MRLRRKPLSGTAESRIVQGGGPGKDIARVSGNVVAYPDDLAREVIRAVNGREQLLKELDEANAKLARYRAKKSQLKPIDLQAISRNSHIVWTHVRFEDYDLSEAFIEERDGVRHALNWLEFGEGCIGTERRPYIGGRIADGTKDFEHDTPYVVWIGLVGLTYKFTDHHTHYFEAHITPNPKDIRIYRPDFDPKTVEDAWECDRCEDRHWTLPDGYFQPPVYELAHVVAGKRINITMGLRWSKLEKLASKTTDSPPIQGESNDLAS